MSRHDFSNDWSDPDKAAALQRKLREARHDLKFLRVARTMVQDRVRPLAKEDRDLVVDALHHINQAERLLELVQVVPPAAG